VSYVVHGPIGGLRPSTEARQDMLGRTTQAMLREKQTCKPFNSTQGDNDVMSHRFPRDAVAVAVESLSWMDMEGLSERLAFAKTMRQLGVHDADSLRAAFLLVIETVRSLNLVDRIASSILSKEYLDDLDLGKRNFLRIFIWWSLLRKSGLKESVALLEDARHVLGWDTLADLEFAFGKILSWDLRKFLDSFSELEQTALKTFNRVWFVSYCYKAFGRNFALGYLKAARRAPPTYLAVNTLRGAEESLVREIEQDGVTLAPVKDLDGLFRVVQKRKPLTQTRAYRQGFFRIQDKSSYLSTVVADPKKDDTVLDLCAAPGGKTSHIALEIEDSGAIYSIDYSHRRMAVWKREMERCNVSCAVPIVADARQSVPIKKSFDLVVVDPPCTNSGAIGKMPSSKWRLTANSLTRLCQTQREILRTAAEAVKPGGRLIYSTCSIMIEENESQIERLLRLNPELKLERHTPFIGQKGLRGLSACQRLYPHLNECNGYFIASLKKEY